MYVFYTTKYYKTAESLSIPVALHAGLGLQGGLHTFAPEFRATLCWPTLLEELLVRHPNLQAYLMHAGWLYISEIIALMYVFTRSSMLTSVCW